MTPTDPVESSPVVEVLVTGPGFCDLERFEVADERSARAFARDVMGFALYPERRKHRIHSGRLKRFRDFRHYFSRV